MYSESLRETADPPARDENARSRVVRAYLLCLLGLGFAPLVGMAFDLHLPLAAVENRALLARPSASLAGFLDGSYFSALNSYFNDHFGFRETIVAVKYDLDGAILRKARPGQVIGEGGFSFYRAFVQQYSDYAFESFPYERWNSVLTLLARKAARDHKTLVLELFRNKEYVYREKLPGLLRKRVAGSKERVPMVKVGRMAEALGLTVIDHTDDFEALKTAGVAVYSPLHEHHPSAEAFFPVVREVLQTLSRVTHSDVSIPRDFPKVFTPSVSVDRLIDTNYDIGPDWWVTDVNQYRSAHHINTDYRNKRPWTRVTAPAVSADHGQFEFRGGGPFPPTSVWGDSFFRTYATQFGEIFLPCFRELQFWANQSGPAAFEREWQRNDIIWLSFADQNADAILSFLETALGPANTA